VIARLLIALLMQAPAQTATSSTGEISGQLSVSALTFPREDATELRPRATMQATVTKGRWRWHFDGIAEGLVADRDGSVNGGMADARDAWVEVSGARGDLRAGYGRLTWGRLDEIQPTDVINPLNVARFLLDGRSDARLPVALVRGRLFFGERASVEGVFAPFFRRGHFDQLDEKTSPFNLVRDFLGQIRIASASDIVRQTPDAAWANVSGGARVSTTIGQTDITASVYRGFDGIGLISFEPFTAPIPTQLVDPIAPAVLGQFVERYPRFTMIGGDFESVTGPWALRGEAAVFVEKSFTGVTRLGSVSGHAIDAGGGFDRRTGNYRFFGSAVVHRQWSADDPGIARTDVDLIGSIERAFHRERYHARVFAVVTPADAFAFIRGLFTWSMRDNVALDGSAAMFLGDGDTTIAQFKGRDFLFARLRYDW